MHSSVQRSLLIAALALLEVVGLASDAPPNIRADPDSTLYVSPNGKEGNPGTWAAPLESINEAVRQAQAGTTVVVRGGVYHEEIDFDHGGQAGLPITVQNYPGETPIIDGSLEVTGWSQVAGSVYRTTFTHAAGTQLASGFADVAAESTCPDAFDYSGDRRALLYVDDTADAAHWLKPLCVGHDSGINSAADLPPGTFATDVPPPPQASGQIYAGTTNTLYVNLADGSSPTNHRIRIAAYSAGLFLWSDAASYITVRGLTLRLALGGVHDGHNDSHITLDALDISLNKLRSIENDFCSSDFNVLNSHIHDIEYEAIHLESDNSLLDNNHIERTLAPWSLYGSIGINVLGNNNRISGNTIEHMTSTTDGRGGFGIFMEEWYNGSGDVACHAETNQNNLLEQNRIHHVGAAGIYNAGGDYNTLRNNLIYNNGGQGIDLESGGTDGAPVGNQRNALNNNIYNNTIYNNGDVGIALNPMAHNTAVRNNIIYNNKGTVYDNASGVLVRIQRAIAAALHVPVARIRRIKDWLSTRLSTSFP